MEQLTREQLKNVIGGYTGGTGAVTDDDVTWEPGPGGNNGNPCPEFCEPYGGTIYCLGNKDGQTFVYAHNCNELPWDLVQEKGLHNKCINETSGSFWC